MPPPGRQRLAPEVFDLPVEKMRAGWYTDAYFNHARATLLADGRQPNVVVQVFQKNHAWLGGMDEAIAILRVCSHEPDALTIRALHDGDRIAPWETVLTIEGDYTTFAHLETVYLGALARRTLITTNVVRVLEAANGKPIIFMPARFDHQRVQAGDGYAAYVAGQVTGFEIGVTSDEQASWWGGRGIGTVPHALIASYGGTPSSRRGSSPSGLPRTCRSPCWWTSRTSRCGRRSRWPRRSATGSGASGSTPPRLSSTARCGRRWASSGRPA
ncbi:MAG: hypothetical protein ACJ75L_04830 [Gaiellaceae bacterium]